MSRTAQGGSSGTCQQKLRRPLTHSRPSGNVLGNRFPTSRPLLQPRVSEADTLFQSFYGQKTLGALGARSQDFLTRKMASEPELQEPVTKQHQQINSGYAQSLQISKNARGFPMKPPRSHRLGSKFLPAPRAGAALSRSPEAGGTRTYQTRRSHVQASAPPARGG